MVGCRRFVKAAEDMNRVEMGLATLDGSEKSSRRGFFLLYEAVLRGGQSSVGERACNVTRREWTAQHAGGVEIVEGMMQMSS